MCIETPLCLKLLCIDVHRKINFEKRVATTLEWLSLPQGERYVDEYIQDSVRNVSNSVFFTLDQTSTLCTWRNRTQRDTVTDQGANRFVIH